METLTMDKLTVGEIVADDFRTASVFRNNRIDFCCGGKKTLESTCLQLGIDKQKILHELSCIASKPQNSSQDYKSWKPDFLCDYIVNTHHQFVLRTLPDLLIYTQKIASVHGNNHPELLEVASLFLKINDELLQHLKKEEEVLFPAIKHAITYNDSESKERIITEINRMTEEHEFAGGAMDLINQLTNHYELPEDSCGTWKVTFRLLEQFEDDLHIHVHLENNILYPAALKLNHTN